MSEVLERIHRLGIVPVVVLDNVNQAEPVARALCDGGLPCAEVTFRSDAAESAIRAMASRFPDMLVGAGTVRTVDQVNRALDAGARFIVSPGLNPKVVDYCLGKSVPVYPGVTNPRDIEEALEFGLEVVKFFPAEAAGGIAMIQSLAAPYPNIRFMPTGGIHVCNLNTYLSFPKVIACGGSWMVKPEIIRSGQFDEIQRLTDEAVKTMLGFELRGVGINPQDGTDAGQTAGYFGKVFEMIPLHCSNNGHIAIGTNSVERAVSYLVSKGLKMDMSTAKYRGGQLSEIYMNTEIGGLAVKLVEKQDGGKE